MVDDGAVERFGRAGQAAGRALVAVAGRRIAARMVVREDDAGAAVLRRVGDDRAERKVGAAFIARVARQVQAMRVVIEVGDPQAFARRIRVGDAAREECTRGREAVELHLLLDALVAGAVEEPARNDPPASPSAPSCYIIGSSPTGDWTHHPNAVALFSSAGWRFVEPIVGMSVVVKSTGTDATYRESGWEIGAVRASRILVDEVQVVGSRAGPVAEPAGGTIVDSEARVAIAGILLALRHHGLIGS